MASPGRHITNPDSLFPDADLVDFIAKSYGEAMAQKMKEIFELDPENRTGFANSVRRSVTHEIDCVAQKRAAR